MLDCLHRRGAVRTFTASSPHATVSYSTRQTASPAWLTVATTLSLSLSLCALTGSLIPFGSRGLCSSKHWSARYETRRRCAARVALRCDSMVLLACSTVLDGHDGPVKVQAHGGSLGTHRAQHDLGDHLRIDEGWSRDSCTPTRAMHRSAGTQVERPRVTTQGCAAAPDDWVAG